MRKHCVNLSYNAYYTLSIFKLLPLLIGVPFCILILGDFSGDTIKNAIENSWMIMSSKESLFAFWGTLFAAAFLLLWYLNPINQFYANYKAGIPNSMRCAKQVIKKFNKLQFFIIIIAIFGFSLGELRDQFQQNQELPFDIASRFMFFSAFSKGLLTGVIISFNLDNILFGAKKAALDMNPPTRLRKTSLFKKIVLVIVSLILFLLFELFTASAIFYSLGSTIMDLQKNKPDLERFLDPAMQSHGLHESLKVLYMKIFFYLCFVFELALQLKYMILHPLDVIKNRLTILNSDTPGDVRSIDIVSNDEFSSILREINKLIAKQQNELQCSSVRLENIVEQAADPIISFDIHGKIEIFNPAAQSFFGYTEEEAIGMTLLSMIEAPAAEEWPCGDCSPTVALIDHLYGTTNGIKRFTGIRKDGERVVFESNVSLAKTDDSVIYTAILRDIAQQMEAEATLTNAKVAAENANRLKSEFLANMSHELRTPLNAVLGFTQLMSGDKNLTPGQLEKISIISRSGEHLLSLINDILDISKIEAGKQEIHQTVFDPTRFIDDIREMFSLRCQKAGLGLYVEFPEPLPPRVRGDLGKLRQVMINLVGNAVKFTAEGGIGIIVGQDEGKIRFSVTDSGKGIPPDELELIMQPFIQSSITDNEGGTGLGLAISSRYIQMMGGKLVVTSEVGKGSTFTFSIELPETDEELPDTGNEQVAIAVKKGSSISVLIVDDKEMNRLVLKEMLEAAGFLTIEAENGKVAVERTKEFKPAIVFMDIKMPVMDGYEAVRRIKADETTRAIPVFALTASAFTNDEEKILASGFDGFLAKPFKRSSLFRLIKDKSGVELEYETAEVHENATVPDPSKIDYAAAVKKLGSGKIAEFADFILINDFTAIKNLALGIKGELPELAALIQYHAESFDEGNLEKVMEKLKTYE